MKIRFPTSILLFAASFVAWLFQPFWARNLEVFMERHGLDQLLNRLLDAIYLSDYIEILFSASFLNGAMLVAVIWFTTALILPKVRNQTRLITDDPNANDKNKIVRLTDYDIEKRQRVLDDAIEWATDHMKAVDQMGRDLHTLVSNIADYDSAQLSRKALEGYRDLLIQIDAEWDKMRWKALHLDDIMDNTQTRYGGSLRDVSAIDQTNKLVRAIGRVWSKGNPSPGSMKKLGIAEFAMWEEKRQHATDHLMQIIGVLQERRKTLVSKAG